MKTLFGYTLAVQRQDGQVEHLTSDEPIECPKGAWVYDKWNTDHAFHEATGWHRHDEYSPITFGKFSYQNNLFTLNKLRVYLPAGLAIKVAKYLKAGVE